jgi:cell envelope opacity-associated protein A
MDKLTDFEQAFRTNRNQWTKAQWRAAALSMAGENVVPAERGRPKKAMQQLPAANSAAANYQALAHEVQLRMTESGATKIKEMVRTLMRESWQSNKTNVTGYVKREGIVDSQLEATYTAVRKILASQRKADK